MEGGRFLKRLRSLCCFCCCSNQIQEAERPPGILKKKRRNFIKKRVKFEEPIVTRVRIYFPESDDSGDELDPGRSEAVYPAPSSLIVWSGITRDLILMDWGYFFSYVYWDFWEVLESLPLDLQKKFLHFTTGSDRVPVGGMSEMPFKITKLPPIPNRGFNRMRRRIGGTRGNKQSEAWESDEQEEQLPEAHTCFNQLVLPPYRNQETLRQKLIIAISNAEGFGLE